MGSTTFRNCFLWTPYAFISICQLGWVEVVIFLGATGEVDYNKKIVFSDEEDGTTDSGGSGRIDRRKMYNSGASTENFRFRGANKENFTPKVGDHMLDIIFVNCLSFWVICDPKPEKDVETKMQFFENIAMKCKN